MTDFLDAATSDPALMPDFTALCAFGGRLAGSGQEVAAMAWALKRLGGLGGTVSHLRVPYAGWHCHVASLALLSPDGADGAALACKPLLRSIGTPDGGLVGEVVDLGPGRTEDFDAAGDRLRGRIALVRHEYPFSPQHMHRRRKYDLAVARGAIGFLIANPWPGGGLMSGSSGRPFGGAGIPAAYIDQASAARIATAPAPARVRLMIQGEELPGALADVGVLDIPGDLPGRIVISAHIDGHDLGVSALDNATGVAVAMAAARALAPRIGAGTRGLRICLFSAEEWALAGSARYLADMSADERASLLLDINLDTVAGDDSLTALISGFPALAGFVEASARLAGTPVAHHLPLMPNSDHANFAAHGIPALRLLAGFDRPESRVRAILSSDDLPDVVREEELRRSLRVTCAMAWQGLTASAQSLADLARRP
jgi:hypothetical protein